MKPVLRPSAGGASPALISAAYALAGALCIPVADQWLGGGAWIQLFKGWLFVAASTVLLYLCLRRRMAASARTNGERQRAEEALQQAHAELERRVQERTAEFVAANHRLRAQIAAREAAELELKARVRQQAAIAELCQRALSGGDLTGLLNDAVALVARILGVEYCKVLELLPDGQGLQVRAAVGFKEGTVGQVATVGGAETQPSYTLRVREPVIIEDLDTETRFQSVPLLRDHGVVSGISVVIPGRERPFGILGAHSGRRRAFSEDDSVFLQAAANVLATAVERGRIEEQTRQQQEELAHMARLSVAGEMASGLAHELNQPLAAITTYAEAAQILMRSQRPDGGELLESVTQIAAQSRRAAEIIRRMRDFTRKTASRRTAVNVNALVREAVQFTRAEMRRHDVALSLDLANPLPSAFADPIQIQQVVLNLVRNAVEALRETVAASRELRIRTALSAGAAIEVAVSDAGPGLSTEAADRLFHPFFTTKEGGMGLGLSISKSIIEEHGGRLWATANPDRGATFHFTVPVMRDRR